MNHPRFSSLLIVFAAMAAPAAAQGTSFYINPDSSIGADVSGAGGPATPFLTLGYALTQPFTAPLTLNLEPGSYSRNTKGEVFPIALPANVTVRGTRACGATINNSGIPFSPGFAFQVTLSNASDFCVFEDLVIRGNRSAIRIRSTGVGPHDATVSRVTTRMTGGSTNGSQGILVSSDTLLFYRQHDCRSTDNDRCLTLSARSPTGQLFAFVERCHFGTYSASVLPGIAIRAENEPNAQLTTFIDNTSFNERVRGVQTFADPAGQMLMFMRHVAAREIGTQIAVGGLGMVLTGGVIEDLTQPPSLTWGIENCAFFDNAVEIASFSPSLHFLTSNLLQDPTLLALGGQITGDPLWVDAPNDDFHLLPGSPCLGAATPGPVVTDDKDGDDRTQSCANTPDIGLDESFDWDFYTGDGDEIGVLGTTESLRFYGDGGAFALFAIGVADPSAQCGGSKLLLVPAPFFLISGLVLPGAAGTRASTTSALPIPMQPALSGLSFDLTTFYVTVGIGGIPTLFHSAELRRLELCP